MRGRSIACGCALLFAWAGCDGNGGTDAGSGADAGATDAGDVDGGGGDAGSDGAVGPPRARGAACTEDAQCQSGVCYNPTAGLELGTGYCTLACTADSECTGFPSDGHEYACLTIGSDVRCARRCTDGFGCPDGNLCVPDFGGDGVDVCLDLSNDACTSNADCSGANDLCTLLIDRERAFNVCFHPRAFGGTPQPYKTVGDDCLNLPETPCTSTAECPTGYRCQRRADGRDVCNATPSESCNILCLPSGQCTGICATDADCPADMRCSRMTLDFLGNTPGAFDDRYADLHLCTYAGGSRTSCGAEGDCDATGAGGSDEVCSPSLALDGSLDPICLEARQAMPGQPCGDDPTTAAVEHRPCDGGCIYNRCGEYCDTDADCPTGGRCLEIALTATVRGGVCVVATSCTTDADCAAGEVCNDLSGATGEVYATCAPAQGGLAGGSPCEVGEDVFVPVADRCDLGCADTGRGRREGRCFERCATDADCPTDFLCQRSTFSVSSGGTYPDRTDDVTTTVSSCTYAPGSRGACTAHADCPAGEVCEAALDATGASTTRCVTEVTGGGEVGEACDTDTPCRDPSRCFSRWDDPSLAFCSGPCARDADCPTGFACRVPNLAVPAYDVPSCMPMGDPRGRPL